MPGPVDPMRPLPPVRPDADGAHRDGREDRPRANLPMVIAQEAPADPEGEAEPAPTLKPAGPATAPFAAQILGQGGIKRGLRGGQEVLDTARSTYLENEYSGRNDRRPPKGRITKTEI